MSPKQKLLGLAVLLILPSSLALLAHIGFDWRPRAHKNYGEMLAPATVRDYPGEWQANGSQAAASGGFAFTRGKWLLVQVAPSNCPRDCVNGLFVQRQIRALQDAGRFRLSRVWVVADNGVIDPELLKAHPDLLLWRPHVPDFAAQFGGQGQYIYLVDPLGNMIMRYPAQPDAKRMADDIKLLLKASQIG